MTHQWVHNASPAINDESEYPKIVGISMTLCILMVGVVSTRLYVRGGMLKFVGADDWVIVAAAICSVTYNGLTVTQTRYGLGLPLADRPKINLDTYSTVNFAGRPFYMMGILGFKVALCLGYLRILSRGQRAYRLIVWGVLVLCTLAHLTGTLVLILNCTPVHKSWRPLTPGNCLPFGPTNYGLAGTTIAFDVLIFLLPIPFLYSLRMNNRKKYGLMGVFLLGLFTTICSIMRMTQVPVIATGNGNSTMLVLWGNIEMNVGIILTCIPVLSPLFKFFGQKLSNYAHGTVKESHNMNTFSKTSTPAPNSVLASSKMKSYAEISNSNESQETILGIEGGAHGRSNSDEKPKNGEILRTIQVEIQLSERAESHNGKGLENFNFS